MSGICSPRYCSQVAATSLPKSSNSPVLHINNCYRFNNASLLIRNNLHMLEEPWKQSVCMCLIYDKKLMGRGLSHFCFQLLLVSTQ